LRAGGNLRVSPDEGGRPRAITDAEDAALAAFVIWLAEAGFPALPIQVEETANYLRDLRGMPPVSEHFVRTWLADHPELQKKAAIKPVEIYRKGAELDPAPIEDFFARYRAIVREYDLGPSEIWNADEGDFVAALADMTNTAFTAANIMRGFEKPGIWPIRDDWLHHTGEVNAYIPFDTLDPRWHNEPKEKFTIDVNPTPLPQHILDRFKYTARPLSQGNVNQALADAAAAEAAGLDFDPEIFVDIDDPIDEDVDKAVSSEKSVGTAGDEDDDLEMALVPSLPVTPTPATTSQAPSQYKSRYHAIKDSIDTWRSRGTMEDNPLTPPSTQVKKKRQHIVDDDASDSTIIVAI
ncbi:hypothetical protein CI238_06420, partial [Colletotrichum incanum]